MHHLITYFLLHISGISTFSVYWQLKCIIWGESFTFLLQGNLDKQVIWIGSKLPWKWWICRQGFSSFSLLSVFLFSSFRHCWGWQENVCWETQMTSNTPHSFLSRTAFVHTAKMCHKNVGNLTAPPFLLQLTCFCPPLQGHFQCVNLIFKMVRNSFMAPQPFVVRGYPESWPVNQMPLMKTTVVDLWCT